MAGSTYDDFEELYELLFKAKERYRSVRAKVVHTVDGTLAKEANRRFIDWRFDQGSPGMGIIGKPGPPQREDFYHEYEDSEEWIRLWHQRPDLWREETWVSESELLRCVVAAGRGASLWIYDPPETAVHVPSVPEERDPDPNFAFILDPSECVFSETFWDGTTVNKTGREATVAGRECVEVRAETVSWGYPPYVFSTYPAHTEGATDHMLLVDAEVGTILRVAARLDGREFRVAKCHRGGLRRGVPGRDLPAGASRRTVRAEGTLAKHRRAPAPGRKTMRNQHASPSGEGG